MKTNFSNLNSKFKQRFLKFMRYGTVWNTIKPILLIFPTTAHWRTIFDSCEFSMTWCERGLKKVAMAEVESSVNPFLFTCLYIFRSASVFVPDGSIWNSVDSNEPASWENVKKKYTIGNVRERGCHRRGKSEGRGGGRNKKRGKEMKECACAIRREIDTNNDLAEWRMHN